MKRYFLLVILSFLLFIMLSPNGFTKNQFAQANSISQNAKTPITRDNTLVDKFAESLRSIPFKPGNIVIPELGFTKGHPSETYESNEWILKSISKDYPLTQNRVTEISEFAGTGSRYYIEDVDQDGTKDLIVERVRGTMNCHRYLYFHLNDDKTLTRIEGPDTSMYEDEGSICWNTSLGFVRINDKTYIAVIDNFLDVAAASQTKTIIELYSLKDDKSRKGLGKIQINYRSQFTGKLKKGAAPSFHVMEVKADSMVRQLSQPVSPPLAVTLMDNPEWTYTDKKAEKIAEAIDKKYYSGGLLKGQSQYQFLDIDNDGKKEIVCHLVYEATIEGKRYSRMVIIKMGPQGPLSYIDVDNYFPELRTLNTSLLEAGVYSDYDELESKGSEYFPISDGKVNYIVKIGKSHRGWRESSGFILGVYKLKNKKIELVDAMSIIPGFVLRDVKVLR